MERQKADARKAWAGSGETQTEDFWFDVRERAGATEFLGYETEAAEGVVYAIIGDDGASLHSMNAGAEAGIIVNQTPFYGESGGQVGDRGTIRTADGVVFSVTSTQKKLGDLFVHCGKLEAGELTTGDAVEMTVDHVRRAGTQMHHSATHLVHEALRQVLGTHVVQRGSLVEPGRFRLILPIPSR